MLFVNNKRYNLSIMKTKTFKTKKSLIPEILYI